MPELPEVETVCRGLEQMLKGSQINRLELRREGLRYPFPVLMEDRLQGATVIEVKRRAKYILLDTDTNYTWIIHLGMSGRIHELEPDSTPGKHDHVIVHLTDQRRIAYNDVRRFGFMDLVVRSVAEQSIHLKSLGTEPFAPDLTADVFHELLCGSKRPIKTILLDQRLVVGLGNIYVCEALWQSSINPETPGASLTRDQTTKLLGAIQGTLSKAIEAGGSTLKDYRQVSGELGYFQHTFNVYDREARACQRPSCVGTIKRITQSGRSTFFCPSCQRRHP